MPDPLAAPIPVRIVSFLLRTLLHALFHIEVKRLHTTPLEGPYILIANHISRWDPLLLLVAFPLQPRIWFLAAAQHTVGIPWRRWFLGLTGGIIPIHEQSATSSREALRRAEELLAVGGVLGIFPEGRVGSVEGQLQPMRHGAATLALRTGSRLLPVWIAGAGRVWFRKRIQIIIGEPAYPPLGVAREAAIAHLSGLLQAVREQADPVEERLNPAGLWLNRVL